MENESRVGIIYRAYNKITEKCYIGQTVGSLNNRISNHYSYSKIAKKRYYFINALDKYNKNDWVWSILETTSQSLLNEREQYWINYYDSYTNGYNSNLGGGTAAKISKTYALYHPDYGTKIVSSIEFKEIGANKNTIYLLTTGKIKQHKGWVLDIHKDNYDSFIKDRKVKKYTFYHKKYGTVTTTIKNFKDSYNMNASNIHKLVNNLVVEVNGWRLYINKNIEVKPKNKILKQEEIVLISYNGNKIEGVIEDICINYSINIETIRHLQKGKQKTIKINNIKYCIFYK